MPKVITEYKSTKYIQLDNGSKADFDGVNEILWKLKDSIFTKWLGLPPERVVIDLIYEFANKIGYTPIRTWRSEPDGLLILWKLGKKKKQFFDTIINYIRGIEMQS